MKINIAQGNNLKHNDRIKSKPSGKPDKVPVDSFSGGGGLIKNLSIDAVKAAGKIFSGAPKDESSMLPLADPLFKIKFPNDEDFFLYDASVSGVVLGATNSSHNAGQSSIHINSLVMLDSKNGSQKWRYDLNDTRKKMNFRGAKVFNGNSAAAVFHQDEKNANLVYIDGKTGQPSWTLKIKSDTWMSLHQGSDPGTLFVRDNKTIKSVDTATGKMKWNVSGKFYTKPFEDSRGNVIVYDCDKNTLTCVDKDKGEEIWSEKVENGIRYSPVMGNDGRMYYMSYPDNNSMRISAVKTDTGETDIIADNITGPKCSSYRDMSVASDGTVFISFEGGLALIVDGNTKKQNTINLRNGISEQNHPYLRLLNPEGSLIIIGKGSGNDNDTYRVWNRDLTKPIQDIPIPYADCYPMVSPDGKVVAYGRDKFLSGNWELYSFQTPDIETFERAVIQKRDETIKELEKDLESDNPVEKTLEEDDFIIVGGVRLEKRM